MSLKPSFIQLIKWSGEDVNPGILIQSLCGNHCAVVPHP